MQTSIARRLGAGALALGLAAGLAACTGAEAAPRPADGTTSTSVPASDLAAAQQVDMVSVFQKAFEAKAASTITLTTTGAQAMTVTADLDNRGSERAVHAVLTGTPLGDVEAIYAGGQLYAKVGGIDEYAKIPQNLGLSFGDDHRAGGKDHDAFGVVSTARLDRTETVDGEQMAVYTLRLDPSKLPYASEKLGASTLPVQVWLDAQQRPRKVEAKDVGSEKVDVTAQIRWDKGVEVKAPASARTLNIQEILQILGRLKGGTSQTSLV